MEVKEKLQKTGVLAIVGVSSLGLGLLGAVSPASAYEFSMTGGLVIEQEDINEVGEQIGVGIQSYMQILKFLGIAILVGVSSLIVNKIFSLGKMGGG